MRQFHPSAAAPLSNGETRLDCPDRRLCPGKAGIVRSAFPIATESVTISRDTVEIQGARSGVLGHAILDPRPSSLDPDPFPEDLPDEQ